MKALYNSNKGCVARPLRPRKRRIGDTPQHLVAELKQLSKWEQIQLFVAANAINVKPIN